MPVLITSSSSRLAPRKQDGVALITAILIAALVSVIAVSMATRQTLDIRRTGNMLEADQAYMYALGMEELAVQVLAIDQRDAGGVDSLTEDWATPLPLTVVEGGSVAGSVEDMQGRFNLNNLIGANNRIDPNQVRAFQAILAQVSAANEKIQISPFMANRVVDWIDADLDSSADGAEDLEYLNADIPYRTSNQFMASPTELGAMLGMSPEDMGALLPFVSALPITTTVNINTASETVLLGLHQGITASIAGELVEFRNESVFENRADFERRLLDNYSIPANEISPFDINSSYFLVSIDASIGRTQLRMYSLLERIDGRVRTIRRSIGTY
ncbi:MAG: type II secretion system minor pseudopilin GspK [Gammaproteobacteria bacterium]